MTKLTVVAVLIVALCNLALAETSLKPYSPFDEPKPRIPKEIIQDKRLDVKVNVFVKSKNFRDLFAEITKQTGVKLTTSHELAAERAIIYFHARPLRDVMTEVSGLFGYYWLPKVDSYELREDSRHAVRRKTIADQIKKEQDDMILELLQKSQDKDWVKGLDSKIKPMLEGDEPRLILTLGTDFLRKVLAQKEIVCKFGDLPPDVQEAFIAWSDRAHARARDIFQQRGHPIEITDYTAADLADDYMSFKRYGGYDMPSIQIMDDPWDDTHGGMFHFTFPYYVGEKDVRKALGKPEVQRLKAEKPLPADPKITADKYRPIGWYSYAVSVGDTLQAISQQSGLDVIADYHFTVGTKRVTKQPLDKTVDLVCDEQHGYVCQFDGATLRFRYYSWFTKPLTEEPPPDLIEKCWKEIGEQGVLNLDTMVDIGCLPDKQLKWPGFKEIPYASWLTNSAPLLRMWRVLGPDLVKEAESAAGLPIERLSAYQSDQLLAWAKSVDPRIESQDLAKSVIRISYVLRSDDDSGNYHELAIMRGDQAVVKSHFSVLSALAEKYRKALVAQRKADAEADKVEVVR